MDLSMITDYLKPELLVLIPVCWGLGLILKSWPSFADKAIPPVMGVSSVAMAAMWGFAQSPIGGYQDALMALFTAIAQGVIASLLANLGYDKVIQPLGSNTEGNGQLTMDNGQLRTGNGGDGDENPSQGE